MKRVLLLTYYVPPRAAIASVRVGQMMRTLPHFGWEVVPVTPAIAGVKYDSSVRTTHLTDYKEPVRKLLGVGGATSTHERLGVARDSGGAQSLRQRAIRLGYEVTEFANRSFGWIGPGSREVAEILRNERFNAVISTSPPEVTHIVAARTHGNIPWIADFRDPWLREGQRPAPLVAIDRMMERRTLRSAWGITTVSEPIAQGFRDRYPSTPVYTIRNAFSESDWRDVPFQRPQRTTFVYAGQLYSGKRDPRPLFEAVAQLLKDRLVDPQEISLDFYGDHDWLMNDVRRFGIAGVVHLHGQRPRDEVLRIERSASRLLMLLWNDDKERGTYTGKLFEYLGARIKILVIGGPETSVVDDVLATTGAGQRCRTIAALRDAVLQAVVERREGRSAEVPPETTRYFESRYLGEQFANVLEHATSRATRESR